MKKECYIIVSLCCILFAVGCRQNRNDIVIDILQKRYPITINGLDWGINREQIVNIDFCNKELDTDNEFLTLLLYSIKLGLVNNVQESIIQEALFILNRKANIKANE